MPVYCYSCPDCKAEFETRHTMSFDSQVCIECGSTSVFRVPSLSEIKKNNKVAKPGKIVDDYIRDAKKEVKEEKKHLRSKEL